VKVTNNYIIILTHWYRPII